MTAPRQGGAMIAVRLPRTQRRLMRKLADRVTQADRFFERRPDRHFVMSSHTPEIEARLRKDVGARS
jgi:hypothetical protein